MENILNNNLVNSSAQMVLQARVQNVTQNVTQNITANSDEFANSISERKNANITNNIPEIKSWNPGLSTELGDFSSSFNKTLGKSIGNGLNTIQTGGAAIGDFATNYISNPSFRQQSNQNALNWLDDNYDSVTNYISASIDDPAKPVRDIVDWGVKNVQNGVKAASSWYDGLQEAKQLGTSSEYLGESLARSAGTGAAIIASFTPIGRSSKAMQEVAERLKISDEGILSSKDGRMIIGIGNPDALEASDFPILRDYAKENSVRRLEIHVDTYEKSPRVREFLGFMADRGSSLYGEEVSRSIADRENGFKISFNFKKSPSDSDKGKSEISTIAENRSTDAKSPFSVVSSNYYRVDKKEDFVRFSASDNSPNNISDDRQNRTTTANANTTSFNKKFEFSAPIDGIKADWRTAKERANSVNSTFDSVKIIKDPNERTEYLLATVSDRPMTGSQMADYEGRKSRALEEDILLLIDYARRKGIKSVRVHVDRNVLYEEMNKGPLPSFESSFFTNPNNSKYSYDSGVYIPEEGSGGKAATMYESGRITEDNDGNYIITFNLDSEN